MTDPVEAPANGDSAPAIPDYLASPEAVFKDKGVQWRHGQRPDYTKTRQYWLKGKLSNHAAGSLPEMVENLVKNWEVEASFKPRLQDWRTIDHAKYTFSMNGGPPQTADHMLNVGTYNAIIATANEYYSPAHSDFETSHKTFKRMMPTFAWEVLEVYSGPPTVAFRWRHWGEMKNDYVAWNNKGEKVTARAHGGLIEIFGVTVAKVDEEVRVQSLETWMDPMALFRQIAPNGVGVKEVVSGNVDVEGHETAAASSELNSHHSGDSMHEPQATTRQGASTKHDADSSGLQGPACPFLAPSNVEHPKTPQQDKPNDTKSGTLQPKAKPRPQRSSKATPQGKRKAENVTKNAALPSDEPARHNGPKRLKMELATEVSAVQLWDTEKDTHAKEPETNNGQAHKDSGCSDECEEGH